MKLPAFNDLVGAVGFIGAGAVVGAIAWTRTGEPATMALGAMISLVSVGAGYFMRGRVQQPTGSGASAPAPHGFLGEAGGTSG